MRTEDEIVKDIVFMLKKLNSEKLKRVLWYIRKIF